MLKIRVSIFVREIGPLTETMPNHGRSFSIEFLISLNKFNLLLTWYFKKFIYLLSCRPGMYCLWKMKIQKALCIGGMEVPLCENLVETI
jgi:hypothetical protein